MITQDNIAIFRKIYHVMHENTTKLIELDQAFGDGDLGISMEQGFKAIYEFSLENEEIDFGSCFFQISKVFNEAAPSSLGTILSFGFMGMAKRLKGINNATLFDMQQAMSKGLELMKQKTGTKLEEKTIFDSLEPAVNQFCSHQDKNEALRSACEAAKQGMLNTKNQIAIHGRSAYHKEKTLGHIDGGAYVSYLIFSALASDCCE